MNDKNIQLREAALNTLGKLYHNNKYKYYNIIIINIIIII
jgi:hypothetical protein